MKKMVGNAGKEIGKCRQWEDFILKRKEYLHFFCFNLLLFLCTYFMFIFFKHYGLDDYSIIADISELHKNALNNGRFSLMVVYDFFIALGFNPVENQTIMAILVVVVFSLSITGITIRIAELGEIRELREKILINLGALILLLNVFVTEWFTFVLSYAQWALGILCAVYSAILMSYSSRVKKILAIVLLALAINAYQTMTVYFAVLIMIFIYLKQKDTFSIYKAIKETCVAALAAITIMGLNIGYAHMIGKMGEDTAASRYSNLSFSTENIRKILNAQKDIWVNGKSLLPHGYMLLFLLLFIVLLLYTIRQYGINWERVVYCCLIYSAATLVTFLPQVLEVWMTPRSLVSLFCLLSISIFFIAFWGKEFNFIKKSCTFSVIIFLLINFYYIQKIAISMFQVNTLEKEHAKLIEYEIDKYERESGVEVEYISFYRDKSPKYKYEGTLVRPGEDMFNKSYLIEWGDIYALNFYTGLSLHKETPEEKYIKYFQEYNWDCLDLEEQLIFDGNRCHYCVY